MFTLETLEKIVNERARAKVDQSYTASLLASGSNKCAEKFGEEAIEAIIAAANNDRRELTKESADVLFHLLVLLKAMDVPLCDVMEELERRTGQTGHHEKASR